MTHIAFIGPQGSGKTTMADSACNAYMADDPSCPAIRVSFADALRREVAFGFATKTGDPRDYANAIEEMADTAKKQVWRPVLQAWGKFRREHDGEGYWCDQMEKWLRRDGAAFSHVMIDDCRYQNEYAMLRRYGFIFVRLDAHPDTPPQVDHDSERDWPKFDFDVYLNGHMSVGCRLEELCEWLSNSGYAAWSAPAVPAPVVVS